MCDYSRQFNQKAKEGMRFIPILLKAYQLLKKLRNMEGKQRFYKLNIGDVLFVSLDIFEKILDGNDEEALQGLFNSDMDGILKVKDKAIDKYLSEYEEVIRMSLHLSGMENYFKEVDPDGI